MFRFGNYHHFSANKHRTKCDYFQFQTKVGLVFLSESFGVTISEANLRQPNIYHTISIRP